MTFQEWFDKSEFKKIDMDYVEIKLMELAFESGADMKAKELKEILKEVK